MRSAVMVGRRAWAVVVLGAVGCQNPPTEPEQIQPAEGPLAEAAPGPQPQPPPQYVSRIAFVGQGPGNTFDQVFTVKRTGDGLTQLTTFSGAEAGEPAWSPAGPSRIAFYLFQYGSPTTTHAYVMGSTGAGLQDLTPDGWHGVKDLAWSPDGTKLAFVDRTLEPSSQQLKVMNADGSGLVQLATDPGSLGRPAWSPDGQRIMYFAPTDYSRTLSNERGVWSIKPDGTGKTKVLNIPKGSWPTEYFQYSPDGTKVALCNEYDLKVMNANGTGLVNLGLDCNQHVGPQWSPNGTRLLTTKWTGAANGGYQIVTLHPDGSDQVQLTFAGHPSFDATWSRGGGWIAFLRQRPNGDDDLWVMSANGSQQTQITSGIQVRHGPSWGP